MPVVILGASGTRLLRLPVGTASRSVTVAAEALLARDVVRQVRVIRRDPGVENRDRDAPARDSLRMDRVRADEAHAFRQVPLPRFVEVDPEDVRVFPQPFEPARAQKTGRGGKRLPVRERLEFVRRQTRQDAAAKARIRRVLGAGDGGAEDDDDARPFAGANRRLRVCSDANRRRSLRRGNALRRECTDGKEKDRPATVEECGGEARARPPMAGPGTLQRARIGPW